MEEPTLDKTGIPTGFPYLDKITGGLHPAELVTITGGPSVGKTMLALNIARNVAVDSHIPVAYFSVEAPAVQIAKRLMASESGIDIHKLKGDVAMTQQESDDLDLLCSNSNLEKAPLYIDDTPSLKIEDFQDKVKHLVEDKGIKLAIVDYIQLMTAPEKIRMVKDRKRGCPAILKSLSSVAKEFGITVVAVSGIFRPMAYQIYRNDFVHKLFEYDCDYIADLSDMIIYMENESEIVKRYAKPVPVDSCDTTIYVAKNGTVLSERTMLHLNRDIVCFQTPDSVKIVINLEWKITGPCPGQWNAYFYNELDGRTYHVYLREDTYWWSASLFSAKGKYVDFDTIPYEQLTDENIPLAFYYDTDIDNGPKLVEEAILYLQHRFPYLLFDSKIREQYDFTAGTVDMDDNGRTELLERRAELMRRYLEKYDEFKKSNP